jgi:hypothetical protein
VHFVYVMVLYLNGNMHGPEFVIHAAIKDQFKVLKNPVIIQKLYFARCKLHNLPAGVVVGEDAILEVSVDVDSVDVEELDAGDVEEVDVGVVGVLVDVVVKVVDAVDVEMIVAVVVDARDVEIVVLKVFVVEDTVVEVKDAEEVLVVVVEVVEVEARAVITDVVGAVEPLVIVTVVKIVVVVNVVVFFVVVECKVSKVSLVSSRVVNLDVHVVASVVR